MSKASDARVDTPELPERFDFVTSDTHFGHGRIIELSGRPFSSVGHMNGELIRRWNTVVKPTDVVVHLGDVALGTLDQSLPLGLCLNGRKYLIPGNHDRVSSVFGRKPDGGAQKQRFLPQYEAAGWIVLPEVVAATLGGEQVLLSHYPYMPGSQPDRFAAVRPVDTGMPLIHGHVHETFATMGRQFNVGVDVRDFTPVHVSVLEEWVDRVSA